MASLINPPLLDKTGKEIVAALTGEEVQPSASQINAPISDATGKAILEAIQQGGGGGGANVLTLYRGVKGTLPDVVDWAYKNAELTEEYQSYSEAENAVKNADIIKIYDDQEYLYPVSAFIDGASVGVVAIQPDPQSTPTTLYLYDSEMSLMRDKQK